MLGKKEGDKFILEGITNFIMKSLESYDGKIIIVTFELPVTTNEIQMDNCILINWLSNKDMWIRWKFVKEGVIPIAVLKRDSIFKNILTCI